MHSFQWRRWRRWQHRASPSHQWLWNPVQWPPAFHWRLSHKHSTPAQTLAYLTQVFETVEIRFTRPIFFFFFFFCSLALFVSEPFSVNKKKPLRRVFLFCSFVYLDRWGHHWSFHHPSTLVVYHIAYDLPTRLRKKEKWNEVMPPGLGSDHLNLPATDQVPLYRNVDTFEMSGNYAH